VWSRRRGLAVDSPVSRRSLDLALGLAAAGGNVLVEVKNVAGVVGVLERDQLGVGVRRVGGLDAVGAFCPQVVDVDTVGVGLHRVKELARPGNVLGGLGWVSPYGQNREVK
jgi:hypothetical protein